MPEDEKVECPECGDLVDPGMCCTHCGSELPVSAQSVSSATAIKQTIASPVDSVCDADPIWDAPARGDSISLGDSTSQVSSFVAGTLDEDECPHFRIEYNSAKVFMLGWQSSFRFRVQSISLDSNKCQAPELCVKVGGKSLKSQRLNGLRGRRVKEVVVGYASSEMGHDMKAEVYLTYDYEGRKRTFVADFFWHCVDSNTSTSKLVENYNITVENVSAGVAADQNLSIGGLATKDAETPAQVIDRLSQNPIWKVADLFEHEGAGNAGPPALACSQRMTLTSPSGKTLHLLALNEVSLGRPSKKVPDIIAEVIQADGSVDASQSQGVSRVHARIIHDGKHYVVHDGINNADATLRSKPSAYGTFLNGIKLEKCGKARIVVGAEQGISFIHMDPHSPKSFGLMANVFSDARTGGATALLLTRTDSIKEQFLILSSSCSLERISLFNTSGMLRFKQGAFQFETIAGKSWLLPGYPISALHTGWRCESYAQLKAKA